MSLESTALGDMASDVAYLLRLSPEMKRQMEIIARADHRSLNAEIAYVLGQFIKTRSQEDSD